MEVLQDLASKMVLKECPAVSGSTFFHSLHSVARMYHKGTELSHESVTQQCPR
jgi:hypothetical protein